MQSDVVAYRGQPIALVVADSLEIAHEAAALVEVEYETAPFTVELSDPNRDSPYDPPNQCEFLRLSGVLARQAGGTDRFRNVDRPKRWVSS